MVDIYNKVTFEHPRYMLDICLDNKWTEGCLANLGPLRHQLNQNGSK